MAASTMNMQLQQTLAGKFARRQPFRHAARAPLRLVRAEDPASPDEGPVSKEIIDCTFHQPMLVVLGNLHVMKSCMHLALHQWR